MFQGHLAIILKRFMLDMTYYTHLLYYFYTKITITLETPKLAL